MSHPVPARSHRFTQPANLWRLFLVCALLPHFWTLLMALRDYGWLSARSSVWDAIGVAAYGLLFALLDSLLLFALMLLLSPLVRRPTVQDKTTVLSAIALLTAAWGLLGQLYFVFGSQFPAAVINLLAGFDHPLQTLYLALLLPAGASLLLAVLLLRRRPKLAARFESMLGPLSILSFVYLCLDLAAMVVVVARNLNFS